MTAGQRRLLAAWLGVFGVSLMAWLVVVFLVVSAVTHWSQIVQGLGLA